MANKDQRIAYGEALVALAEENPNIVVLDADLGGSTMGKLFEQAHPQRHFEIGIAEANMTSIAAGLAQTGKIPFVSSFAVFAAGRAYDQIRQTICIGKLNVKICGSSAGLSDFGDGSTHQAVEDIAIMRAIPNMTVLCPADGNETAQAVKAMAEYAGPCYLRVNRNPHENITPEDKPFVIGEPTVLREGNEVVLFATGIMVEKALCAAENLKKSVSVRVVNVSTLKPLSQRTLQEMAAGCVAAVTAEEHSVVGGLGSVVLQALRSTKMPVEMVGIEDSFGCSAHNYEELLQHYQLTQAQVERAVAQALQVAKVWGNR